MPFFSQTTQHNLFLRHELNHATTAQQEKKSFHPNLFLLCFSFCSDDSIIHKLNHTQNGYQLLFDTKRSKFNWLQWHHVQFDCVSLFQINKFCQHFFEFKYRWWNREWEKKIIETILDNYFWYKFTIVFFLKETIRNRSKLPPCRWQWFSQDVE